MLALDDDKWSHLDGGYRKPFDPRDCLAMLRSGSAGAWSELWSNLYHQGDIGEASYASVPHIVDIYASTSRPDWNPHALVGSIELARDGNNPSLPMWASSSYNAALEQLATRALADLGRTDDPLVSRSALGVVALAKGLRSQATVLLELTDDEVDELLSP